MKFKHHHIHIYLLIGGILIVLALIIGNIYSETVSVKTPSQIGVSFSPAYAAELGLDPKKTYQYILNDLDIKHIRLNAYWNEIEKQEDRFDFSELDYYINQAGQHGASVYLTVGYKLPRWPECRMPDWLEPKKDEVDPKGSLTLRQKRQTIYVAEVVKYYDKNPTVTAFQIENEPLLEFGECPKPERERLKKEVEYVRTLTKKPLILTDSGELRPWVTPMRLSDIFGTTLYRTVDAPVLGQTRYPLQPWFYRLKSNIIRKLFAQNNQKTIIAELQAETWAKQPLTTLPIEIQTQRFSLDDFKKTLDYSKRTGFDEIYLWGVEWWYYLSQSGHPEYLDYAKSIF